MQRERFVGVVGADLVRRDTIARAFEAAGFRAVVAARTADLDVTETGEPVAFVFDVLPPGLLESEVSEAKARWPAAVVWSVSETAKLVESWRSGSVAEPAAQYLACEGILQQALLKLVPKEDGVSLEERVLRAKQEFESLFDSIPDPIFVVSDSLVIARANKAFFGKAGKPASEVLGRHCVEVLHGILQPWSECLLARVLKTPQAFRWQMPDVALGETFECTTFPVVLAGNTMGVAHHLRAVLPAERQAEGSVAPDKLGMFGRLAASIAHELNNPLGAVLGFAEILENSGACPEEFKADLRQIRHEAWRCERIVSNLLHLARTPEPDRRPTDINELIERAIAVRSYRSGLQGARTVRAFAGDIPPVMVDPDQIEQVVLNLLTNAQEAVAKNGIPPEVTITASVTGSELLISVADNGRGIEPDTLPHIFDLLFTTKGSGTGTGLGLSVSRTLVRQHGGEIDVRTGKTGTEFTVRLPLIVAEEPARQVVPARPGEAPEGRVLVVDDEPAVRAVIGKLLRADGHTVVTCKTPEQAVEAIESQAFDLVIADLTLLEVRGEALLRCVRDNHPHLIDRFILTTGGLDRPGSRVAAYSGNPVLLKPFTSAEVRRCVASVLPRAPGPPS